ncbi:MAG: dipeptidyl-peptidase 3 family protein [Sphingomicrobium sp.]
MTKHRLLAAAAAVSALALGACATVPPPSAPVAPPPAASVPPAVPAGPLAPVVHDTGGLEKLAVVQMNPATGFLNAEERQVVNLLNQAGNLMSAIYLRQLFEMNPEVRAQIAALDHPERGRLLEKFDAFFGPWDPIEEDAPFFGNTPRPDGAGFYPADMTKAEFDAYVAANPGQAEALTSPYTVVRRQGDRLVAIPYSQAYRQWLEPAAKLLEQAAAITTNASLKRFLSLRAQSFRTDDYYQSELAWMDLEGTPIEIAIGPYEVYDDRLYGRKTAFEAFVTLKDPKESAALDVYKGLLRDMEANLPVEERFKNFQRGFESPIAVADQVHGGGDNVPGVQTIAFNLPNDERVREAKGAKKVILRNVLGAKYDRILQPMAPLIFVPANAGNVTQRYMFMETLFHELSHSLGPGTIVVDGRKTTVDAELKELHTGIEEAKADVMGAYNVMFMMDRGVLPRAERDQIRATYIAGLFRAMRFGTNSAHGRGAAMQYGYLRDKGALVWDEAAQRFRIDNSKIDGAIRDLVGDIVRLQATGDYAGTKALMERWAELDPQARQVIASMQAIPVDIRPVYPERV